MAKTVQFHVIQGRLVKDPTLKTTKNGKLLLVFPLAFRSPVKTDDAGSTTSFIDVEMWEKLADYHAARLKKGMEVVLEGHLVQRRWRDAENRPHAVYRFIAQQLAVSDLKRRPEFDHVREAA